MMVFQAIFKISNFSAAPPPALPAPPPGRRAAGWKIFFRQNLLNNILGKVKKFGYRVAAHLGAVNNNIGLRVILTPPRVR